MTGSNSLNLTLPSDREIRISREFAAPRALVFEAHTKPEHVRRWWGERGSTMTVCDMDFRPGGGWRFVLQNTDGSEHAFRGTYKEIAPPGRLVATFEYEPMAGHIALETQTFEENDGRTQLTSTLLFDSQEDRDGMLQMGMESGSTGTWDRLADHLREEIAKIPA